MRFEEKSVSTSLLVLSSYFVYVVYIFHPSIFSIGIINGEDAGNPITPRQVMVSLELALSTLGYNNLLPFKNIIAGSGLPLHVVNFIFSKLGLTTQFPAILFTITYVMAAHGIFFLARYLDCTLIASYLAGLLYVSSPIFFNYTIFGWNYVLIAMAIMPYATLYYIRSIAQGRLDDAIKSGLLFFLATMQSQSFLWFPIIYFAIILSVKFQSWARSLFLTIIVMSIGLLLNLHVILPAILFPDDALNGSSYVFAGASLGTTAHFYPLNSIRLFGALFNYQYENIWQSSIEVLITFIFPVIIICGVIANRTESRKQYINAMLVIFCIPLFIWFISLNREILIGIPFSNIFRDLARFSVLPAFGFAMLVAFGITCLSSVCSIFLRGSIYFMSFFALCFSALPFVNGNFFYDEPRALYDSRISHQSLDQSYLRVENFLAADSDDFKVVYLPMSFNASVKSVNIPQFKDGFRDIFAIYSPKPGLFSFDDRGRGDQSDFSLLTDSLQSDLKLFNNSNVKYFVFRNDLESYIVDSLGGPSFDMAIFKTLSNNADVVLKDGNVTVFKNKNWDAKVSLIYSDVEHFYAGIKVPLSFIKVDPTLYLVKLRVRPGDVSIRFLESWSNYWKLKVIPEKYFMGMQAISLDSSPSPIEPKGWLMRAHLQYELFFASEYDFIEHSRLSIGSNHWIFSTIDLCNVDIKACHLDSDGYINLNLAIEFQPQKYFFFMLAVSFMFLLGFCASIFRLRGCRKSL